MGVTRLWLNAAFVLTACRLLGMFITGWLFHSSVCISYPNRSRRIVTSDFSLCLASPSAEFCRYPSALRPKIFVNRCPSYSDAEDQFFSAFRIDTVLVRTHFWIRIVLVS